MSFCPKCLKLIIAAEGAYVEEYNPLSSKETVISFPVIQNFGLASLRSDLCNNFQDSRSLHHSLQGAKY
jgi:hypothetical protein